MSEVTTQYQYSQYYQPQYQNPWYYHQYPRQPYQQRPYYSYGYPYPQQQAPYYPHSQAPMPQPGQPPQGGVNPYGYNIDVQLRPYLNPIGKHIMYQLGGLHANNWNTIRTNWMQIRALIKSEAEQIIAEMKTLITAGQGSQVTQQWLMAKIATASQELHQQLANMIDPNIAAGAGASGGQIQGS